MITQAGSRAGRHSSPILAAAYFEVSGGVVTVRKSKNVDIITRLSVGSFFIKYSRELPDQLYMVLASGRPPAAAGSNTMAASSFNAANMQTTQLVINTSLSGTAAVSDPANLSFMILDIGAYR